MITNAATDAKNSPRTLRYVLALLALSVFINYIDRGNLSIAAPMLKDELGMSASQLGLLLSSFFWTYSFFQILSGYTNFEHERLIRQAERIALCTERLFREAGIAPGQRVLDLGSGVGDVSMLLARIVGSSGEVVGIERDARSIARANARAAESGLRNISFIQTDVNQIVTERPFDAAVGRFILMFLPDPASVLRSLTQLVRPGGIVAFQECSWAPFLALAARFPLRSKVLSAIHETFLRSGVNPEIGIALYQIFQQVGLPAPSMPMETLLGSDANLISLIGDLLTSMRPLIQQHNIFTGSLGNLDTLSGRIQAELVASNTGASFVPLVGVWARKPMST